jgi:hypothetical protein
MRPEWSYAAFSSNTSPIPTLDNLGSADSLTITASRLPEGKFSVRSGTSQIDTVILAGQVLELRMRNGQVHALRKRKTTDPYSRLEELGRPEPERVSPPSTRIGLDDI